MALTVRTSTGKVFSGSLPELLKFTRLNPGRVSCDSCAIAVINGLVCHEHGCPDAWRDETRQCRWCGAEFYPKDKSQGFCEKSCEESYYG